MLDINNLSKEQKDLMEVIQKMKESTDRTKPIESENFKVVVGGQYQELFSVYDKQNNKNALVINFWFNQIQSGRNADPKLVEAAEFVMKNNITIEKHNTLDSVLKEAKARKENRDTKTDHTNSKDKERE